MIVEDSPVQRLLLEIVIGEDPRLVEGGDGDPRTAELPLSHRDLDTFVRLEMRAQRHG